MHATLRDVESVDLLPRTVSGDIFGHRKVVSSEILCISKPVEMGAGVARGKELRLLGKPGSIPQHCGWRCNMEDYCNERDDDTSEQYHGLELHFLFKSSR